MKNFPSPVDYTRILWRAQA